MPSDLALADLYNTTGGSSWSRQADWLNPQATNWQGVSVAGGRVTALVLDNNHLIGAIPDSLGNLSQLQDLDLSGNRLVGGIPANLGNLTQLSALSLFGNQLTGGIPATLGSLTNLQYIALSNNQLVGSIPASIGNLSNLLILYLFNNQLVGGIPASMGNLSNLQSLYLSNNQLSGSIPDSLGNLTQLHDLLVFGNQLVGGIPASLGNLTQLQNLFLDRNQLTGGIPASLGNLTQLQQLFLRENKLVGDVPDFKGFTHAYIDISDNYLNIAPGSQSLSNINAMMAAGNTVNYLPQTPLPSLNILRSNAQATLMWPASAASFVLEVSDTLSTSPSWTAITNGITTSGNNSVFTTDTAAPSAFYRLRKNQ